MVPVYAIGSLASLHWRHGAIYFDTARDWCEAHSQAGLSRELLARSAGSCCTSRAAQLLVYHHQQQLQRFKDAEAAGRTVKEAGAANLSTALLL